MNPEELKDAFSDVLPDRPSTAGWGPRARRRHRNRRAAVVGVGGVAAVAVLALTVQLGSWGPAMTATPVTADSPSPVPTATTIEPDACGARVEFEETVAEFADVTSGFICGPQASNPTEYVQVALSEKLVEDVLAEIESVDTMAGLLPGLSATTLPSLVLLDPDGNTLTLVGSPEHGYSWYPPTDGGLHLWEPSPDIAARMLDEIRQDGRCTLPNRLSPADVHVQVYDAGGGAEAVAAAVAHLTDAGFPVTDTGETAFKSLGGPIILRGSNGHGPQLELVGSYVRAGGEMSRDDGIVDVLVTDEFTPEALRDGVDDVPIGTFFCTPQADSPTGSPSTPGIEPTADPGFPAVEQCHVAANEFWQNDGVAPSPPGGELPDAPDVVWLCLSGLVEARSMPVGTGMGMVSMGSAPQAAVDLYNGLPESGDSCAAAGDWGFVVFDYAGEDDYLVQVHADGCVVAGSERRQGGDAFRAALWELEDR